MSYIFSQEAIDGFTAFIKCGGSRDQVVREMSEFIYLKCSWKNEWNRHQMLEQLIKLVYEDS